MEDKKLDYTSSLEIISKYMVKYGQTIAVAESVTSGDLQSAFSSAKDATQFFQGGITVYNINQKVRHLHVEPIHAISCNCVSDRVAEQLAENVNKLFTCDWGIGVTGYAAPMPEKDIEDLFAFVSIYYKDECMLSEIIQAAKDDPVKVREFYTYTILNYFSRILEKKEN